MRAFGRNGTVARQGSAGRRHELAISFVLVEPRDGADAVEHPEATPKPVTAEGGIVRFALSPDEREAA
jgi:hypothetical protein